MRRRALCIVVPLAYLAHAQGWGMPFSSKSTRNQNEPVEAQQLENLLLMCLVVTAIDKDLPAMAAAVSGFQDPGNLAGNRLALPAPGDSSLARERRHLEARLKDIKAQQHVPGYRHSLMPVNGVHSPGPKSPMLASQRYIIITTIFLLLMWSTSLRKAVFVSGACAVFMLYGHMRITLRQMQTGQMQMQSSTSMLQLLGLLAVLSYLCYVSGMGPVLSVSVCANALLLVRVLQRRLLLRQAVSEASSSSAPTETAWPAPAPVPPRPLKKKKQRQPPPPVTAENVVDLMNQVRHLAVEEQIQQAYALLLAIEAWLTTEEAAQCGQAQTLRAMLQEDVRPHMSVAELKKRGAQCIEALNQFNNNEGWELAQEHNGIKTYTKANSDDTSIWAKVEGEIHNLPPRDCLCMWKETQLYNQWIPTCHSAEALWKIGRSEVLTWFAMGAMGINSDAVLHGWGADSLDEGYFLIVAQSVEQSTFPDHIFPPLKGLFTRRIWFQGLWACVEPLSSTSVRSVLVINTKLKVRLPKKFMNFMLKHVVGLLFSCMAAEGKKIQSHPMQSRHAREIEAEPFYREWLQPKIAAAIQS